MFKCLPFSVALQVFIGEQPVPSQLLNPDPQWQGDQKGLGVSGCLVSLGGKKHQCSSNVETGDTQNSKMRLEGGSRHKVLLGLLW